MESAAVAPARVLDRADAESAPSSTTEFLARNHLVSIAPSADGRRRISVEARGPASAPKTAWTTAYSEELVRVIVSAKGASCLCDEIRRDEDPNYLRRHLELTVAAHVDPAELRGAEVLDFGCGAGASTVILSQLLPESRITGVELRASNLEVARARARFYGLSRTRFLLSPAGSELPKDIGRFGAVMLSAVFEHLLPEERRALLPALWRCLAPGGVLFIDETPARWFPIETHTTGLPLINYLPDGLAAHYARLCSHRIRRDATWRDMQRDGIRGATVREIVSLLPSGEGKPILLEPRRLGINGALDLWIRGYAKGGYGWRGTLKKAIASSLSWAARRFDGAAFVPYLSLAIRKAPP